MNGTTLLDVHGGAGAVVLAAGYVLVSWYKPLLVVLTIIPWAIIVSKVYDKDAARWYFMRQVWNLGHVAAGLIAVLVVLVLPLGDVTFWIAWPVMIVILAIDLLAYALVRNASDRVPASHKWSLDFKEMAAAREANKESKLTKGITMRIRGPAGDLASPAQEDPLYEIRVTLEDLLQRMIDARATEVQIRPAKQDVYAATARVDGVRHAIEQLPAAQAVAIIDYVKEAGGLDPEDRRRRLVGEIQFGEAGGDAPPLAPLRITTSGTTGGQRLTLLINPSQQVTRKLDDLGLHNTQKDELARVIKDGKGVVLVAAMPGNGRTTTLHALLRAHDAYTSNVQTVEMDPQAVIEGVRHNHFDPQVDGAEYSTTVRSILRRDPDVVGVAEMPDENTGKEVARADHDHTRTYLGLSADTALAAVQIYARAVGDQSRAAGSLHGVIAQTLLRRLCTNCRVPFHPTPDMLRKLSLPSSTEQLYRKGGNVLVRDKEQTCPVCGGTGFFGQVGAFAVHGLGKEERELVAKNDLSGLRARFRQKKQPSIQTSALQHVLLGNTSVEEVVRAMESGKRKQAAKPPTKAAAEPSATPTA